MSSISSFFQDAQSCHPDPKPWMQQKKFTLIRDMAHLRQELARASAADIMALDLETQGLDNRIDENGRTFHQIVGYCFAYNCDEGFYVPVRHVSRDGNMVAANLPYLEVDAAFRDFVATHRVVYHNSGFDQEFLYGSSAHVPDPPSSLFEDTLILDYLKDSTSKKHGLKSLSKEYLGLEMHELKEFFPKKEKGRSFAELDPTQDAVLQYAGADAICTYMLYQHLKEYGEEQKATYKVEKALVPALRWTERNRMKVDLPYVSRLQSEALQMIEDTQDEIYASLAQALNKHEPDVRKAYDINSPTQLGHAFEALQQVDRAFGALELEKTENSGQIKTDNASLEKILAEHGDRFPFLALVQKMRGLQKVEGTYIRPIKENTRKEDSTIRFSFQANRVDTGRFAASKGVPDQGYSGINVQSIPGTYSYAKFYTRKVHSRPKGAGKGELEENLQKALDKGFLRLIYDGHFMQDLRTGEELCVRSTCDGCPFASECKRDEPVKGMFYSIENAVRPAIVARDGYVLVACVEEGSLVSTPQGLVPIEEVQAGSEVITEEGSLPVSEVMVKGTKRIYEVETEKGVRLRVTPDHLVRTLSNEGNLEWKEAQHLSQGDWLIHRADFLVDSPYQRLPQLQAYEPHYNEDTSVKIPTHMSEDLAWFLGWLMGDGSLSSQYVGMSLGKDLDEVLPTINLVSERLFGKTFTDRNYKGDCSLHSKKVFTWLNLITQKSDLDCRDYRVPSCILQGGRGVARAYLRGFFAADGSASDRDGVYLYTVSHKKAQDVHQLLLGLGIFAKIKRCDEDPRLTNYGVMDGAHVQINGKTNLERFQDLVGFGVDRKDQSLARYLEMLGDRDLTDRIPRGLVKRAVLKQRHVATNRIHSNSRRRNCASYEALEKASHHVEDVDVFICDEILSRRTMYSRVSRVIDTGETAPVYDISVPGARNFQASGVIVHNCDYSGLELRAVASICEEPRWLAEFYRCSSCDHEFTPPKKIGRNKWEIVETPPAICPTCGEDTIGDLHTLTTKIIYGDDVVNLPPSEFKKKRQNGKGANFSIVYGGGGGAIARATGVDSKEGWEIRNKVLNGLPTFKRWMDNTIHHAHQNLEVETAIGRKIRLWDINSEESWLRAKQERNAINSIVQGTATGDLIKYAMAKVHTAVKDRKWEDVCRMCLTIHDELVFEIRQDMLDEVLPVIDDCMTEFAHRVKWPIPLVTDVEFNTNWSPNYNWTLMHSIHPKTKIAAEPTPSFLLDKITMSPGMWYKEDDGTQMVWTGDEYVPYDEFNADEVEMHEESPEPVSLSLSSEEAPEATERGEKVPVVPTLPFYDYTATTALSGRESVASYMTRLRRVCEACKMMAKLGMCRPTHTLRVYTIQHDELTDPEKIVEVEPKVFRALAFYEGL